MSIKISKILMFLAKVTVGSLVGVVGKYLISKTNLSSKLSKQQLFIKIEDLFLNISSLIANSPIKEIFLEFKYNLPGKSHQIFKTDIRLLPELTNWFKYWLLEEDIYFSTSIKENKNSFLYEIFCKHNDKKYKFALLISNKNKANYETFALFFLENINPLIKQLNELIFVYYYE